jgi:hypothetical protein
MAAFGQDVDYARADPRALFGIAISGVITERSAFAGAGSSPHRTDHRGAAFRDADHDVVQQVGDAIAAPRLT